jgi:hypothetical protein
MFRADLNRSYGWDVELSCSHCTFSGLPRYEGRSPSLNTNNARNVVIHAKLACPQCGSRLTSEAGRKLIALFGDMDISERNRKILVRFITRLFLVPAVLAFVLFFGMQMDWWRWGLGTLWVLLVSVATIPLVAYLKKKELAGLPMECECGKPHYIFMGSIDNNHCFRCFSCGRLLKVRE